MEIVCHEAKKVQVRFHSFGVHASEVPIVWSEDTTKTILGTECSPQLLSQEDEIRRILNTASPYVSCRILPVN